MFSVWWDFKRIVYFETDKTTINSEVYCNQLDKLRKETRIGPHTSLITRQKLLQLEWDMLPHPPYAPDLAPSDYYLFRSLQNFLNGRTFSANHLNQSFASKDPKCYECGINLFPERWQRVLDQNGEYIIS